MPGAVQAAAMWRLCEMLEHAQELLLPDDPVLAGYQREVAHLHACGAIALAQQLAQSIVCPECSECRIAPEHGDPGASFTAYCPECGCVSLGAEQARPWQVQPQVIGRWLQAGFGLGRQLEMQPLLKQRLWYLGRKSVQRKWLNIFFGVALHGQEAAALQAITKLANAGAAVLVHCTDTHQLLQTELRQINLVPLRSVAQLRKGSMIVQGWENHLTAMAQRAALVSDNETSLRLLQSHGTALVNGKGYKLPPQAKKFLLKLIQAEGEEVSKQDMAYALGVNSITYADIKRRHPLVFDTFVVKNNRGQYFLNNDYLADVLPSA